MKNTTHWPHDIKDMHTKFKVRQAVKDFDVEKLRMFLRFRLDFIREELEETEKASIPNAEDPEEIVDGFIDLIVVSLGTLDAFGVDPDTAWNAVHEKNMSKQVGVKAGRENPLGLPDLVKPEGWSAPSHANNHGDFAKFTK